MTSWTGSFSTDGTCSYFPCSIVDEQYNNDSKHYQHLVSRHRQFFEYARESVEIGRCQIKTSCFTLPEVSLETSKKTSDQPLEYEDMQ